MSWIGRRYEDFADGDGVAGCWGLVRAWYRYELGIELPPLTSPDQRAEAEADWLPVRPGSERRGDLVELALPGAPLHVGVVMERGRMLHVCEGIASRIDRYDREPWSRFVRGLWRWRW